MEDNLDILFIGGLFPKEKEKEILENSKGNVQNAANNLQWGIVSGLDANLANRVKILNSLYIGSFPYRYKRIFIDTYKFSHTLNADDINVGFINLIGIKQLSRSISLKPYVKDWAKKDFGKQKVVIAYAMTSTFTGILRYVKKIDENIITCLIVPDLPQYMNLSHSKNKLYEILKENEVNKISKDKIFIDSYVLLTKHMRNALKINTPTVVIEGIATELFESVKEIPKKYGMKTVLYTGGLEESYGVISLLNAFEKLSEQHYQLIICGAGEAEIEIIKASKRDKRIIFKGLLPRSEILKLQKSSDILVNPRPNNEEFTKYSFPSKILEYMSSGTPVISYKLDGIPEEYYKYMYLVNEDKDGLFNTLKEVLSKSEKDLNEKGLLSKQFVLREKNSTNQGKKIINMINSLIQ